MTATTHSHRSRVQPATHRGDRMPDDFDLPLVGAREAPRVQIDWEAMMEVGTQPALLLGAERRWRGPR
jgi:hypothetical protein